MSTSFIALQQSITDGQVAQLEKRLELMFQVQTKLEGRIRRLELASSGGSSARETPGDGSEPRT